MTAQHLHLLRSLILKSNTLTEYRPGRFLRNLCAIPQQRQVSGEQPEARPFQPIPLATPPEILTHVAEILSTCRQTREAQYPRSASYV